MNPKMPIDKSKQSNKPFPDTKDKLEYSAPCILSREPLEAVAAACPAGKSSGQGGPCDTIVSS